VRWGERRGGVIRSGSRDEDGDRDGDEGGRVKAIAEWKIGKSSLNKGEMMVGRERGEGWRDKGWERMWGL
jgi:hypothetical protein